MIDYSKPFCVEASNNPNCETAVIAKFFTTLEEAKIAADKLSHQFHCLWISEIGTYTTRQGNDREDWMYFWWSPPTDWGEVFDRGTGYAADYPSQVVNYYPISK